MTRRVHTDPDALSDWRNKAACKGQAALMTARTNTDTLAAKRLCFTCPVMPQCRSWALSLPERIDPGGVCGGLTEPERATRRRIALAKARPA
ncbi:WhiB family transcriptional regulator [Spirillospora sp. CA-253888]